MSMADSSNAQSAGAALRPPRPAFRSLQVYAFDPSLATQLDTAVMNHTTIKGPWGTAPPPAEEGTDDTEHRLGEEFLQPGPIGEYVEVIDYDPASGAFYAPVNLNDAYLL